MGFSIPINNVKKAIDDFIAHGKVKYGWLGVQLVQSLSPFKSLDIKDDKGALVVQLFIGSPADKAGILLGDFIELNGKKIESP